MIILGVLPITIDQLEYEPGLHTLSIVVVSSGRTLSSEVSFVGVSVDSLPRKLIRVLCLDIFKLSCMFSIIVNI